MERTENEEDVCNQASWRLDEEPPWPRLLCVRHSVLHVSSVILTDLGCCLSKYLQKIGGRYSAMTSLGREDSLRSQSVGAHCCQSCSKGMGCMPAPIQ